MSFFVLTQDATPVIGQLTQFFGLIMNAIFNFFNNTFGIQSIAVSIVVFTIFSRLLMLPLAFKQQKSMKEMQVVQPELKKIQEKYKTRKDPESQKQMQMEQTKLYQQHNVNPFGGCLPLLIQFPIIMSLYNVLRNVPAYIGYIKNIFADIAVQVTSVSGHETILDTFNKAKHIKDFDSTIQNKVIDLLGQFSTSDWTSLTSQMATIADKVQPMVNHINDINYMFGINLADKPNLMSIGVLIPILNVVVQFLVSKTSMSTSTNSDPAQAQTQKTMMYTMPLITVFFVIQMPAGLGLYWFLSSAWQLGQQIVINNHLHKDKK